MFINNELLAVDLGSRNIKVLHGRKKGNGIMIINHGECPSPCSVYSDSELLDRNEISKALGNLLEKRNIKCKNIIMGIKGQDVITRHIEMPLMSDKQLKQAVKLEIQQYLPMDPKEYVIDSKKICKIENGEKKAYNILLVAAPKKRIDDYINIVDKLGLKLKAIDLYASCPARFFETDKKVLPNEDNRRCISMIDIGYESSIVTLIENGRLFFEREVGIGVKEIDSMIKKIFPIPDKEVESIRNNHISLNMNFNNEDINDPRIYYANNNARVVMDDFMDRINKVFDFYISSGFNKTIDRIYLYGGGSKLDGIVDYIKGSINIDTLLVNDDILSNVYNADDDLKNRLVFYANCISLLMRKD